MRSSRPSAATAGRKSHASRAPCERRNWCWRGVRGACEMRAAAAPYRRFDRIIARVFKNRA
eukprot:3776380-Lingulodinium_polyedra.AAC.1